MLYGWIVTDVLTESVTQDDETFAALDHLPKVREKLFHHRSSYGKRRGVRLDIPSVKRGLEVVSIHEKPTGGTVIGYDHSATIDNAKFYIQKGGAEKVGGGGGNKFPFAFIGGKLSDEQAKTHGVRVYYDPRKVHLFVDASNMRALKGAKKVFLVGKATYAVGPDYYDDDEIPAAPEGMDSLISMPNLAAVESVRDRIRRVAGLADYSGPYLKESTVKRTRLFRDALGEAESESSSEIKKRADKDRWEREAEEQWYKSLKERLEGMIEVSVEKAVALALSNAMDRAGEDIVRGALEIVQSSSRQVVRSAKELSQVVSTALNAKISSTALAKAAVNSTVEKKIAALVKTVAWEDAEEERFLARDPRAGGY